MLRYRENYAFIRNLKQSGSHTEEERESEKEEERERGEGESKTGK